jgi:chorismate mutase
LVHWNTDRPVEQVRHVYLGQARALRPDVERG